MPQRATTCSPASAELTSAEAGGGWRRRLRRAAQTFQGVVGADAYDVYLEHQARTHPGEPVMSKREFWKDKTDRQDRNPSARCC